MPFESYFKVIKLSFSKKKKKMNFLQNPRKVSDNIAAATMIKVILLQVQQW